MPECFKSEMAALIFYENWFVRALN